MIDSVQRRKRDRSSIHYLHRVGNEWVHASLDEPHLLDRLLSAAQWAQLPLFDKLIVLIACSYGVGIRDILRLTIGDWLARECQLELRVSRQMSRGQGVRVLRLSPGIQSLLRAYIRGERKESDPEHRENRPIVPHRSWARLQVRSLCSAMEEPVPGGRNLVALRGLRHWFVIRLLRQIEERIHDPGQQQGCRAALIKYMGWQSLTTLRLYEREYQRERFIREFDERLEELFAGDPLPSNERRSEIE